MNWLLVFTFGKYQVAGNLSGLAKPIIDTIGNFASFITFAVDIIDLIQKCASSQDYALAVLIYTMAIVATVFLVGSLTGFWLPFLLGLLMNVAMNSFKDQLTTRLCRYDFRKLRNEHQFA